MFPRSFSIAHAWKGVIPLLCVTAVGCGDAGSSNSGIGQGGSSQGGSSQGGSSQGGFGGDGFGGSLGVDSGAGGAGNSRCASGAEWIYLVDSNNILLQFRPDTLTLTPIGNLNCPSSSGDTPFSMAVDRDATAWVLYQSGNIFHVDTSNAACTATGFQPGQSGLTNFGMGFVSNDDDEDETLYVAGGTSVTVGNATLAWVDTQSLQLSTIGQINGWPELTGTGSAQLWAFSPNTNPPTIQRLDKTSGAVAQNFNVSQLAGNPSAWAFAFWGGGFYVFLQRALETSTNIWFFDPNTQNLTQALGNTGYRIVGAGVSTCAPLVPPA